MRRETPVNSNLLYLSCNSGWVCISLRGRQGHILHFLLPEPWPPVWNLPSAQCPATLYNQHSETGRGQSLQAVSIYLFYMIVNLKHWGGSMCKGQDIKTVHSWWSQLKYVESMINYTGRNKTDQIVCSSIWIGCLKILMKWGYVGWHYKLSEKLNNQCHSFCNPFDE